MTSEPPSHFCLRPERERVWSQARVTRLRETTMGCLLGKFSDLFKKIHTLWTLYGTPLLDLYNGHFRLPPRYVQGGRCRGVQLYGSQNTIYNLIRKLENNSLSLCTVVPCNGRYEGSAIAGFRGASKSSIWGRVSMGLTDRRKTPQNLVDNRKNWKILTVSRK